MRDISEIRARLHAYRDFADCVVKDIAWHDYGTTICVSIDYIWKADGTVRPDAEERLHVHLTFRFVRQLVMHNDLRAAALEDPTVISWSINEIALMEVRKDENPPPDTFLLAILWFQQRPWVEISFNDLEFEECVYPADQAPWQ